MNAAVRVKVEAAGRARDFLRANPIGVPNADLVVVRFGEKVDRANELLVAQSTGMSGASGSRNERRMLRNKARREPLMHLARVAEAVGGGNGELAKLCRRPSGNISEQAFLTAAYRSLEAARAHQDLLVQHGLMPSVLDELEVILAEHDRLVAQVHAAERAHTAATAELRSLSVELTRMMKQIGGLMMVRFRDNPELKAAWQSARNIEWPLGLAKGASKKKAKGNESVA